MKLLIAFIGTILSGCAITNYNPNNIIDITDDQWLEDFRGNRCLDKEMLITPDSIIYLYSNCPVRRVVKPKVHPLPKPVIPHAKFN